MKCSTHITECWKFICLQDEAVRKLHCWVATMCNVLWICCMFKATFLSCNLALKWKTRMLESNLTAKLTVKHDVKEWACSWQITKMKVEKIGGTSYESRYIPETFKRCILTMRWCDGVWKVLWPKPSKGHIQYIHRMKNNAKISYVCDSAAKYTWRWGKMCIGIAHLLPLLRNQHSDIPPQQMCIVSKMARMYATLLVLCFPCRIGASGFIFDISQTRTKETAIPMTMPQFANPPNYFR